MDAHEMSDLLEARLHAGTPYHEFLQVSSLSAGIYELPKDGPDPQTLHDEDELYYVVRGHATIRVGGEDRDVQPGSVVSVPSGMEHRFHRIREDLSLLVFFAPARGSLSRKDPDRPESRETSKGQIARPNR